MVVDDGTIVGGLAGRNGKGQFVEGHKHSGSRLGCPNKAPHLRTLMAEHGFEWAVDTDGTPVLDDQGRPVINANDAMNRLHRNDPAAYVRALERFSKHGGSTGGSKPVVIVIPSNHPGAAMIDVEAVETPDPNVR